MKKKSRMAQRDQHGDKAEMPAPNRAFSAATGARIRAWRLDLGLSQAELAARAGISASYLNLIEHGRRAIAGQRLVDLARQLGADPARLSAGAPASVLAALGEAPRGERADVFALRFPGWARRLADQRRLIASLEDRIETVQDRMARDPALAAALHQIISSASAIQSTAAILVGGGIDADWQAKFQHNVHDDSQRLAQASRALVQYLEQLGEDDRPSPSAEAADWLRRQGYHFAALESGETVESVLAAAGLSAEAAQTIAPWLEQYRQDAALLPWRAVAGAVRDAAGQRPDPMALAQKLGVPLAQVFRRLASLPPAKGLPEFGITVCDGAGVVTLQKPVPGAALPETGACPLWPIFEALAAPGRAVRAIVALPDAAPLTAFAIAGGKAAGFDDLPQTESLMLTMTGVASGSGAQGAARPVGTTCRACPRAGCAARREPQRGAIAGTHDFAPVPRP